MTGQPERPLVIQDDKELRWALDQYFIWSGEKAGGTDSGIANMLGFIRNFVFIEGRPFRPLLIQRLVGVLREAEHAAFLMSRDLALVVRYITDMLERHSDGIDYYETFCYASMFLFEFDLERWSGSKNELKVSGARHQYLQSLRKRYLYYWSLVSGDYETETEAVKELDARASRPLLITGILRDYYNIPFYVGYKMQAFQEGAALSEAIYDYVFSERSRGHLSSLLPSDGPTEVDYSRNGWVWAPENKKWIGEDWEQPIEMDPRFREMMMRSVGR